MVETRTQILLRLNAQLKVREERYVEAKAKFDALRADLTHEHAAILEDQAQLAYVARSADAAGEIRLKYEITETT